MIPTVETERLVLRGHRLEDFEDVVALWADPVVTRHIGGRPFARDETWPRLLRNIGHWTLLDFGFWIVHEKATGRFVGEMGFGVHKRDIDPPLGDAPEAGWVLLPWAHGRGLATEGMRAVLAWGDAKFNRARTVCIIDPGNTASLRVADKLGYKEYARTTFKGTPTILLER
jgi:RimJ/RimL family protein N-acetyltransferase